MLDEIKAGKPNAPRLGVFVVSAITEEPG